MRHGRQIAFLGCDVFDAPEFEPQHPWLVPADGGRPTQVAGITDGLVGTWAWSELDLIAAGPGPLWLDKEIPKEVQVPWLIHPMSGWDWITYNC